MNRSTIIKGRILRSLIKNNIQLSSIQDEEIYSELTDAQNHILDDITPHTAFLNANAITDETFYLFGIPFLVPPDMGSLINMPPQTPVQYVINETTEPTLPNIWDKALQYKATSEFMEGDLKAEFLSLYEKELVDLRGSANRSDYPNGVYVHRRGFF
jgi:hypothetical protein